MRKILTLFFALAFSVSSAYAGGTLTLMGYGGSGSSLPPASVVYRGTFTCSTAASSCTYSNAPIGAASAGRIVVATVGGCSTRTNSVTIGGATPTTIFNGTYARIFYRAIPTGTTATVVSLSQSGTCTQSISVFTIDGLQNMSPLDSGTTPNGTSNPKSVSLSTQSGGVIIAIVGVSQSSGGVTLSGVTENNDTGIFTGTIVTVGSTISNSGTTVVTSTHTASPAAGSLSAVSWR